MQMLLAYERKERLPQSSQVFLYQYHDQMSTLYTRASRLHAAKSGLKSFH